MDERLTLVLGEDDLGYIIQLVLDEKNNYVVINGDMLMYPKENPSPIHKIYHLSLLDNLIN